MQSNVIVIGAGGFGRETLDVIQAHNQVGTGEFLRILGVFDDSPSERNLNLLEARGVQYLGTLDCLSGLNGHFKYFIGIGSPKTRSNLAIFCDALGLKAGTIIHPSANIGSQVKIGEGTVICAGAQISTNVSIGKHVHINPSATVGHDSSIGDFASLNPRSVVSGDVTVGTNTLVGAGSVILEGLHITSNTTIGASACVTKSIEIPQTVVGVPATKVVTARSPTVPASQDRRY